ncbi:MAG: hypothetical protein DMF09_09140 [Verrucomicrobia bacterium]|nr:MAG: hypothetical protein DMF09_09140 [Verrucomicrobiota bacterium]
MRIAVVGSGAIGSYYGAHLAHGGADVHFLMRGDLNEVRRHGFCVRGKGGNFRVANVNCYNSTKEIGQCDLVIIAVKATSNGDLLDLIPPLLHKQTMLATFQNGLGNEEFFAEHFGAERVLGGLCFICVTRISRTEVEAYNAPMRSLHCSRRAGSIAASLTILRSNAGASWYGTFHLTDCRSSPGASVLPKFWPMTVCVARRWCSWMR